MQKYPLIGASIIVAVLIVLGSLTNVIGFQTIQALNQKIITTKDNPKELLFQTIVDMANNKEIQKVILGSELTGKRFFGSDMRFSTFTPPVLTEEILKRMYTMGVILSKTTSKSKIHSMIKQYQVSNQGVQKEINGVIEKDAKLKGEMTQLSSLSCDCENENTTVWHFPVLCTLLLPIYIIIEYVFILTQSIFPFILSSIIWGEGQDLHCFWVY